MWQYHDLLSINNNKWIHNHQEIHGNASFWLNIVFTWWNSHIIYLKLIWSRGAKLQMYYSVSIIPVYRSLYSSCTKHQLVRGLWWQDSVVTRTFDFSSWRSYTIEWKGILLPIPQFLIKFAGLGWGHFKKFDSGSKSRNQWIKIHGYIKAEYLTWKSNEQFPIPAPTSLIVLGIFMLTLCGMTSLALRFQTEDIRVRYRVS